MIYRDMSKKTKLQTQYFSLDPEYEILQIVNQDKGVTRVNKDNNHEVIYCIITDTVITCNASKGSIDDYFVWR